VGASPSAGGGALSWCGLHRVTPPILSLRFAGVGLLWADEAVSTCSTRNHLERKYPKRTAESPCTCVGRASRVEQITSPSAVGESGKTSPIARVVVGVKPDDWVRTALCPESEAAQTICDEPLGDFGKLCHRVRAGVGIYQVGDRRGGVEVYQGAVIALGSCNRGRAGQMAYDDIRHPP
jgi:hypothetical protein